MAAMIDPVFIVGGGPSVCPLVLEGLRDRTTIAINKSLFAVPNPKFFVTVDYSFVRKYYGTMKAVFEETSIISVFIVNMGHPELVKIEDKKYLDTRLNITYDLSIFTIVWESHCIGGIGVSWEHFRTGDNSGYCALQLAVVLGFTDIYLLGIDLQTQGCQTHFHGGYGQSIDRVQNDLSRYYEYFKTGLHELSVKKPSVNVYSCSATSRLNDIIPYIEL